MANYDFGCSNDHVQEVTCRIADREIPRVCDVCGEPLKQLLLVAPAMPTTIILDYTGSKRLKAGYVHSHGDKPATKLQFGYGGAVSPERKHHHPIADITKPDPFHFRKFKRGGPG